MFCDSDDREWIIIDDEETEGDLLSQLLQIETPPSFPAIIPEYYTVLCIDVGVINLGMALLVSDPITYAFQRVGGVDLVNITEHLHEKDCHCTMKHTRTFTDWMEHLFEYYKILFDNVDRILVERQPPCGFVAVEQLIYSRYRNKCELISPNSVHKYHRIGGFDYDGRKEKVVEIALKHLKSPQTEELLQFERKHDMGDAICMGLFWLGIKNINYLLEEDIKRINILRLEEEIIFKSYHGINMNEYLKHFRFILPPEWKSRVCL
jgi:hypothetical protein